MDKNLLKINIQKDWKKPQEMIFQKLIFDELKEIEKHDNSIEACFNNSKTGFKIRVELSTAILKRILKEVKYDSKTKI